MSVLILHVGLHKTGTTTVQASLDAARANLRKQRIQLFRGRNHGEFYRAFTDRPELFHRFYRSWERNARQEAIRNQIKQELTKHEGMTHIVCSEDLSLLSTYALEQMKAFLARDCGIEQIKIVCVLRNPFEYLNSILQQYVKPGLVCLEDLCAGYFPGFAYQGVRADGRWDYYAILSQMFFAVPRKLVEVFGGNAVTFLEMGDSMGRGLVQNMLSAAGLEHVKVPEIRMNSSMSHEACILLGEYNNRNPLFSAEKGFNPARQQPSAHIRFLRSLPGQRPLLLHPGLIDPRWMKVRLTELNEMVARRIFDPDANSTPPTSSRDLLRLSQETVDHLNQVLGYTKTRIQPGPFTREQIDKLGKRIERDYSLPRQLRKAVKARTRIWQ